MDFPTVLLWIAAVVFVFVAVQGLFLPKRILEPLGGKIDTPSVANEIRANYGGMHAGIAALMVFGALKPELRMPAVALLLAFSGGLCVGRAVSWVADGTPNRFVRIFFGLELGGAIAAGVALFR
jgi:hypothetical protein